MTSHVESNIKEVWQKKVLQPYELTIEGLGFRGSQVSISPEGRSESTSRPFFRDLRTSEVYGSLRKV